MFVSSHSVPERSGAATLTLALTAGVLVAMATLAPTVRPPRAPSSSMRLFDMPGAEAPSTSTRQPESAPPSPSASIMARAAVAQSAPVAAQRVAPSSEAAPAPTLVAPPAVGLIGPPIMSAGTSAPGVDNPAPSAPAGGGEPARHEVAADAYGRTVFREIRARQSYPEVLARAGLEGTVVVELRISPRGRIVAASVHVSSQVRQLDETALAQVRATPLPPPPRGEARIFRIPMTYRIG